MKTYPFYNSYIVHPLETEGNTAIFRFFTTKTTRCIHFLSGNYKGLLLATSRLNLTPYIPSALTSYIYKFIDNLC